MRFQTISFVITREILAGAIITIESAVGAIVTRTFTYVPVTTAVLTNWPMKTLVIWRQRTNSACHEVLSTNRIAKFVSHNNHPEQLVMEVNTEKSSSLR